MTARLAWCGSDLSTLIERIDGAAGARRRTVVGITGPPGAGKSTLAASLVAAQRRSAALLPMDGFHLADCELERLGRQHRKGAPDTFDANGFVHLLRRVRAASEDVVYAPLFVRERELAVAGALAIPGGVEVVVVEGNYLLLDGAFSPVRTLLDECWYLELDEVTRRRRLVDRHVRHGRSGEAATAWVEHTDDPNARLIASTRARAQVIVEVSTGDELCDD